MFKPNTKFLVVDDSLSMRKIIKKSLAEIGFKNIVEAESGKDAYEMLVKQSETPEPVEFIISDWNMPVMLGINFLKKCKAEKKFESIPFIIVTAEHEKGRVKEAFNSGALDFILKPFSSDFLKSKFETYYKKLNQPKAG